MPTLIGSEAVTLSAGFTVSLKALQLLWRLEARGVSLEREGNQLAVSPRELLTAKDHEQIGAHRDELLQLVDYVDGRQWEM